MEMEKAWAGLFTLNAQVQEIGMTGGSGRSLLVIEAL